MRRKVVLYNPNAVFYTMPLGLVAIGSALDADRYDVRIVDGRLEKDPLRRMLDEADGAVCVGVSVLTGAPIRDALRISRAVKARHPRVPVVWGGWHASLFPAETLEEPAVDVTVQGQGETTFRDVVERLEDGASLRDVAGIAFRSDAAAIATGSVGATVVGRVVGAPVADENDGAPAAHRRDDAALANRSSSATIENGCKGVVRNVARPMTDLNALPPHDYGLLPVEQYFRLKKQRQLDYVSSAGCFWRCAFCADPFVYKRRWTALEPARMAEEIEELYARFGFTELAFQDETFFTYAGRVREIVQAFLVRDFRFRWTATMRADQGNRLSDDDFRLLAESGLSRVLVGVESGSQEMLDWMKKDVTLDQVVDTAEKCLRHGVGGIFPFIVGFPGESAESVDATIQLARRLRSMSPHFETPIFYFKPYPGSEITASVVRDGYRIPDSLAEWADFDFVGSAGPWVTREKYRRIERFKFFNRAVWASGLLRPLQTLARWRCRTGFYGFPIEKLAAGWLRPSPKLS